MPEIFFRCLARRGAPGLTDRPEDGTLSIDDGGILWQPDRKWLQRVGKQRIPWGWVSTILPLQKQTLLVYFRNAAREQPQWEFDIDGSSQNLNPDAWGGCLYFHLGRSLVPAVEECRSFLPARAWRSIIDLETFGNTAMGWFWRSAGDGRDSPAWCQFPECPEQLPIVKMVGFDLGAACFEVGCRAYDHLTYLWIPEYERDMLGVWVTGRDLRWPEGDEGS